MVVLSLGAGELVVLFGKRGGRADQSFDGVFPLLPAVSLIMWVGAGELGLLGVLPNETNGLIFSTFSFGLKVVVYEVLVGVCVLVIPISIVSGKIINGLLVVLVGVCVLVIPISFVSGKIINGLLVVLVGVG